MVDYSMVSILGPGGILSEKLLHYEFRPQQVRMSESVADALQDNRYVILEAGTGIGKTIAYLIPAILSEKKVVISTGTKNLQEQIYFKDIPLLRDILNMDFFTVHMKGRNNYLCRRRFKQLKVQYSLLHSGSSSCYEEIKKWAVTTKTGDRSELERLQDDEPLWDDVCSKSELCLGQKCESFDTCFITKLRQDAAIADLIIVNHHLFFADLSVKGTGYGEIIPEYDAVIFDEAHQLEDIATNYFGIMVSNYRFEELARDIKKDLRLVRINDKKINQALDSLLQRKERFFNCFHNRSSRYRLKNDALRNGALQLFGDVWNSLEFITAKLNTLECKTEEIRSYCKRASEIKDQLSFIMHMENPHYVYWCENRGKGVFLHASPIDVSHELKARLLDNTKSIIFTSATVSTNRGFTYFKDRLGLDRDINEMSMSSSFDYRKQSILYLPKGLPDPNASGFVEVISEEIERILSATSGRAFILFTSYRNMKEVHSRLKHKLPFPVLVQGENPKSYLLSEFKKEVNSVLFATQSFWEGVDVQGEALSCVIIDKLPFASPSEPIVEARIEEISRNSGNPFLDYQLPSAIVTLKQGLGRLIRNKNDRGVFSILDNRIFRREYGNMFIKSLPDCPITNNLDDVKKFFDMTG
ncbi:MAG: ATP-dependent DNA helicase [Thermodesulfobacteriota bacterium]|nr:ATP-dependent DNA helicase [Thermodesulfobacteriota bacterium]